MTYIARVSIFIGLLALSPVGFAGQSWIVDDDAGPGVDFTELQAAVDSPLVADGDTLLVQPGEYVGLTISRPLRIIGQGASPSDVEVVPSLSGGIARIRDLTEPLVFANLQVQWTTYVSDCSGTVTFSHVDTGTVNAYGSSDVRIQNSSLTRSTLYGSSMEIASCQFSGPVSLYSNYENGSSYVRAARSSMRGLHGDNGYLFYPTTPGGPAIRVGAECEAVLIGGGGSSLTGGDGGIGEYCSKDQPGGPAIRIDAGSSARESGYVLAGGFYSDPGCNQPEPQMQAVVNDGTYFEVTPRDPSLELLGPAQPGSTVGLVARAPGAASLGIFVGFTPLGLELPNFAGRLAVSPDFVLGVGSPNAAGELASAIGVPALLSVGAVVHAQAISFHPGAEEPQRLSNPVAIAIQ